jgi:hypothetical protein
MMTMVFELTVYCPTCHDLLTVFAERRGPLFTVRSPHVAVQHVGARISLMHRPKTCGGILKLLGSQQISEPDIP